MYIEVEHAHKRYEQGGEGFTALRDVSLSIEKGEFICFLGPSGCGKSTLLNAIAGFERLNSGTITIDGKAVEKPEERYVMIFQNYGLLPWRTARANVSLGLEKRERNRAVRERTANHYLELVGLAAQADRFPAQLSGGQQQRVAIARALATDPDVLFMDEPFGAVDPLVRRELQREMVRIQAELGKTIIFVTHDVDEALALGDEIILLREGAQIAQRGSGAELLADPADDFVARFLGLDDAARQLRLKDVAETRIVLDRAGRAVGRLSEESVLEAEGQA